MKIYTVQKGDTLYKIAKNHNITLDQLLSVNPNISNPDHIMPGMKIKIPAVKSGTAAHHSAHDKTKDHYTAPVGGIKGTAPKPHFPMMEAPAKEVPVHEAPPKKHEYKPTAHLAPLMPLVDINVTNQEINEKFIQKQITQPQHEAYPNMMMPKAKPQGTTYPIHKPHPAPQVVSPYQAPQMQMPMPHPQPYPCYPPMPMPMPMSHGPCGCREYTGYPGYNGNTGYAGYAPQSQPRYYQEGYYNNSYPIYSTAQPQQSQQNMNAWNNYLQSGSIYNDFPRSFPTS